MPNPTHIFLRDSFQEGYITDSLSTFMQYLFISVLEFLYFFHTTLISTVYWDNRFHI